MLLFLSKAESDVGLRYKQLVKLSRPSIFFSWSRNFSSVPPQSDAIIAYLHLILNGEMYCSLLFVLIILSCIHQRSLLAVNEENGK